MYVSMFHIHKHTTYQSGYVRPCTRPPTRNPASTALSRNIGIQARIIRKITHNNQWCKWIIYLCTWIWFHLLGQSVGHTKWKTRIVRIATEIRTIARAWRESVVVGGCIDKWWYSLTKNTRWLTKIDYERLRLWPRVYNNFITHTNKQTHTNNVTNAHLCDRRYWRRWNKNFACTSFCISCSRLRRSDFRIK